MKWVGAILALIVWSLVWPLRVSATSPDLLITAVLAGTSDNAKQEFIELYNASDQPLDFRDGSWRLEIASSSAADWQKPYRSLVLDGYLYPDNYYLLGSAYSQTIGGTVQTLQYPESSDQYYSAALSSSAGHIRLVQTMADGTDRQSDVVEWGGASTPSLASQSVFQVGNGLAAGSILSRQRSEDRYLVSGQLTQDFAININPLGRTTTKDQPWLEPTAGTVEPPVNQVPLAIELTEILPNPAAPYSDDNDEYVELLNPNSVPVDLGGYSLQIGTTKTHKYTFTAGAIIAPQAYAVFYSAVTGLTLSNSGGQVKLLDPNGNISSVTDAYGEARDGLVWQWYDNQWQWSAKQTPGEANQYLALVVPSKTNKTEAATKSSAASKAATSPNNQADEAQSPVYIHNAILAAVVGLALLYGGYEYRHDLANRLRQLRSHRGARRHLGPTTARR